MTDTLPKYEVFAIRYATVARRRSENFLSPDPHDGPMPMDYFVWVIRNADRLFLVDCGFNQEAADQRKRQLLTCPIQALEHLGIKANEINDLILTHLHYDHAGNIDLLPHATIHLQERELHYATGRYMHYDVLRHSYSVDDVVHVVHRLYDKQLRLYTGDTVLAPGLELVLVGGHTNGLQAVRVHTARGWVVLASDASHFYDNICHHAPFPLVFHVGDMLTAYDRLISLAESPDHVVPGHDPLVFKRYPTWGDPAHGIVLLHEAPALTGGQ